MQKFILPVAFLAVAIGALVWAMMPARAPEPTRSAAAASTPVKAPVDTASTKAVKGRAQVAINRPSPRPVRNALPAAQPTIPRAKLPPMGDVYVAPSLDPAADVAGGDTTQVRIPKIEVAKLKASVRAYYANLPKSGRMPSKIFAEEVLPASILETINVPGQSLLTDLGTWPTTSIRGFKEALELPDDGEGIIGVTVLRPDGTTIREYIQTF